MDKQTNRRSPNAQRARRTAPRTGSRADGAQDAGRTTHKVQGRTAHLNLLGLLRDGGVRCKKFGLQLFDAARLPSLRRAVGTSSRLATSGHKAQHNEEEVLGTLKYAQTSCHLSCSSLLEPVGVRLHRLDAHRLFELRAAGRLCAVPSTWASACLVARRALVSLGLCHASRCCNPLDITVAGQFIWRETVSSLCSSSARRFGRRKLSIQSARCCSTSASVRPKNV